MDTTSLNLTIDEAATLVGVSSRTLKRMIACGQLPEGVTAKDIILAIKVRGRRLFVRAALVRWVEAGCPVVQVKRRRA